MRTDYGNEMVEFTAILPRGVGDRLQVQLQRAGVSVADVLLAFTYKGTIDHFLQEVR